MFDGGLKLLCCGVKALPGQQTPDNCPSFKLVIVGDGGTGMQINLTSCGVCLVVIWTAWNRSLMVVQKNNKVKIPGLQGQYKVSFHDASFLSVCFVCWNSVCLDRIFFEP
jgi:hypothetical protein